MRFLLIGDHPDGVEAALALVAAGRHELAAYAGPANAAARLQQAGVSAPILDEAEAALALKGLDFAIVADELPHRPAMLKRALQSELNVAVVHPPDLEPDIAYEALLIQQDTRKRLVPLLPERSAPALQALSALVREQNLGQLQQLDLEVRFAAAPPGGAKVKQLPREWEGHPLLTLWEPLRLLGGEIQDLSAVSADAEELRPNVPILLSGRFRSGTLLQAALTPQPSGLTSWRLTARGAAGEAVLTAPEGFFGPAALAWNQESRSFPAPPQRGALLASLMERSLEGEPTATWTDATRCLELFDAARRSVKRKRLVLLDYDAVSESGNFKSTMTALGCATLLFVMVLFFATPSFPFLKYLIPPVLGLYLAMQLLRWVARDDRGGASGG